MLMFADKCMGSCLRHCSGSTKEVPGSSQLPLPSSISCLARSSFCRNAMSLVDMNINQDLARVMIVVQDFCYLARWVFTLQQEYV